MDDPQVLLSELVNSREHAAALLRAKLDAVASQIQELANRTVGELQLVLPPDLEVLFPLAQVADRLEAMAAPPPPPPPPPAPRGLDLAVLRTLDSGKAQSEVLQELLRQLGAWAGPRAIVVFREGQAAGWAGGGFGAHDPVRTWRGAINESPVLTKVAFPIFARAQDDLAALRRGYGELIEMIGFVTMPLLVGLAVTGILEFARALFLLPARLLGGRPGAVAR